MSKDFMDELSAKVGGQRSQKKDYKLIINELKSLGENNQTKKKLNEELAFFSSDASALEEKSKWKEASVLYFEGAMILKEILSQNDPAFHQWIDRSSQCLVNLANEYATWKEIDRASASISVASLIHFLKGEWTLISAYNEFNSKYGNQIQTGKTAAHSMWIPYDLVNSIDQINAEFLQRAESYTQTALLTETKVTESFRDAIFTVLENAREAMTKKLKLPNLETNGILPKDIIFGEKFNFNLEVKNIGEGNAKNVTVTINKLDGLNLVNGSFTMSFESLNVNSSKKISIELTCPSGEGVKERKFDLSGKIEFFDIINNKRQNPLGPYTIIVRAFRKADELRESLGKVDKSNSENVSMFTKYKSFDSESKLIATAFLDFYNKEKIEINRFIESGEYVKAELNINKLSEIFNKIGSESIKLLSANEELHSTVAESKNIVSSNLKQIKDNLTKVEKSISEFENKWK